MVDIRIITFDLDNTLWDVNQVILSAQKQLRSWLDVHVPAYNSALDTNAVMALRNEIIADNPKFAHDPSALREEVIYRGMLACGYTNPEARTLAQAAFEKFYEARQQVVLFDGALEVLEILAGKYLLGALTNGNADIGRIGLDKYFAFAFSSAVVGASKPAPDMFLHALRHSGVQPEQSIHIGDHLIDDIQGANLVGMHTIWVNHTDHSPGDDHLPPSAEVTQLAHLPAAVEKIHRR